MKFISLTNRTQWTNIEGVNNEIRRWSQLFCLFHKKSMVFTEYS